MIFPFGRLDFDRFDLLFIRFFHSASFTSPACCRNCFLSIGGLKVRNHEPRKTVAQASESAVSHPAPRGKSAAVSGFTAADRETGDTAGSEACATMSKSILIVIIHDDEDDLFI
jgi:hypothetical protein